jgi:hypothetical protein
MQKKTNEALRRTLFFSSEKVILYPYKNFGALTLRSEPWNFARIDLNE